MSKPKFEAYEDEPLAPLERRWSVYESDGRPCDRMVGTEMVEADAKRVAALLNGNATAYVVVCHGKPVASFRAEHLAEHYVDHADEPQHCSIEEVESD